MSKTFKDRWAEIKTIAATTPDGFIHVIHCDVPGCREMQPYPGPEETRNERAFADGWVEDENGDASCPRCAVAAGAGSS